MSSNFKGLIYRYHENRFINSKGEYVDTTRVSPLKRQSCSLEECGRCAPLREFADDWLSEVGYLPEIPKGVKDGDRLILSTRLESTDWESGISEYEPCFSIFKGDEDVR